MAQQESKSSGKNELSISVEVRPGRGDAAFIVDVHLGNFLTIYDCVVFKNQAGLLQPNLPVKTVWGERFPLVDIEPKLHKKVFESIQVACDGKRTGDKTHEGS